MSLDPLPRPAEKARAVREMFDRIAPDYDRMNRLMTGGFDRLWRRGVIERAGIRPGDVVVDVACGTGDLGRLAARSGARVVGADFSPAMLERAERRGLSGRLVRADALALPLRRSSADVVLCGFALRNFVAIPPFFEEAARVLKPGGRIVLLEVATPGNPVVRLLHRVYFHHVVPLLGALVAERRAYAYLPRSVVYLPSAGELLERLAEVGFVDCGIRSLGSGGIQILWGRLCG